MPKPGYTQSPEHKKKRLEQIEGDGNGSYKDGRRSYRRKAGAKDNDGTVVHHKNGDRTNNCASNLERLTDGDRKPGRRTTPAHEKHHGGRHGDSIDGLCDTQIAIRLAMAMHKDGWFSPSPSKPKHGFVQNKNPFSGKPRVPKPPGAKKPKKKNGLSNAMSMAGKILFTNPISLGAELGAHLRKKSGRRRV
jgi:hypothetical protein